MLAAIASVASEPKTPEERRAREAEQAAADERFSAMAMCEQFVTQRLKAPSTAKFSSTREQTAVKDSTGHWLVTGHVDAQNGFGAMLRNQYACDLVHVTGETWRLVDIALE